MADFFDKFKQQAKINESFFDKILPKKDNVNQPKVDNNFIKSPNGTFVFGGKNTAKELNSDAEIPLTTGEFNLQDSKLNFMILPGTEFKAEKITLNLKNQIISFFKGDWISGPFFGQTFQGSFAGSSFQGNFYAPYSKYEAHPTTFIEGTFRDTTNQGILGMPNTTTLNKAYNRKFNLITLPVGYYLQFRSINGITGYIKMIKRLDGLDSNFELEVLNGFTGQKSASNVYLPWTYFRQNWKKLEINPKNPRDFGGLIVVPEGDFIQEMYISVAPATFKSASSVDSDFNSEKKYLYNLDKIPYLDIKGEGGNTSAILKFDSKHEFEQFQKIVYYIKSGTFSQDVKNIAKAVKYGEIDGYGPFKYLSSVFNKNEGVNVFSLLPQAKKKTGLSEAGSLGKTKFQTPDDLNSKAERGGSYHKKKKPNPVIYNISEPVENTENTQFGILNSMQRLNDFMKYFFENIITDEGQSNVEIQNLILMRLKAVLGTDSLTSLNQRMSSNTSNQEPKQPGMPDDFNGGFMKESARKIVRNIIKDNF